MRPISPDVWDRVAELACGMTNALCAKDFALCNSLYEQFRAFYEDQARQGTLHPFVVESLADFTRNREQALRLYREALEISEPDEPRYTILIAMAQRLIEVGQAEQAEACLREGLAEAQLRKDGDSVIEAERLLLELGAELKGAPNGSSAKPVDNLEPSDGPPSAT